jgi:hypothetical protein
MPRKREGHFRGIARGWPPLRPRPPRDWPMRWSRSELSGSDAELVAAIVVSAETAGA